MFGLRRFLMVLMLACAVWSAPRLARACSCGSPSPTHALENSDLVFRGTVVGWDGKIARFDVAGYYKGSGPAEVHVRSGAGLLCGRDFIPEETYVVFTSSALEDSLCSATFAVTENPNGLERDEHQTDALLKELGVALAPPVAGPPLRPGEHHVEEPWEAPPAEPPLPAPPPQTPAPAAASPPPAKSGCLGSVQPAAAWPALILVGFAALRRRRRAP